MKRPNRGLAKMAKKKSYSNPKVAEKIAKVTDNKKVVRKFKQPGASKGKHGVKSNLPEMS